MKLTIIFAITAALATATPVYSVSGSATWESDQPDLSGGLSIYFSGSDGDGDTLSVSGRFGLETSSPTPSGLCTEFLCQASIDGVVSNDFEFNFDDGDLILYDPTFSYVIAQANLSASVQITGESFIPVSGGQEFVETMTISALSDPPANDIVAVPEPRSVWLMGIGLGAMVLAYLIWGRFASINRRVKLQWKREHYQRAGRLSDPMLLRWSPHPRLSPGKTGSLEVHIPAAKSRQNLGQQYS